MNYCIYVLIVSIILFEGCTTRNRVAATFSRVESMMEDAPDSALVLLRGISAKGLHSRAERARYALLYAEVEDRVGFGNRLRFIARIGSEIL